MTSHQSRAHARLSASGSKRWMNCTPSAKEEDKYPDKTSDFAREGTLAHEIAEIFLRKDLETISTKMFEKKMGEYRRHPLYLDRMEVDARMYRDYVMEVFNSLKGEKTIYVEQRVHFDQYVPDGFGTADVIIVGDEIHVIDYKYGRGIAVYAERNPQGMLYALGALQTFCDDLGYDKVGIHIYQPRLDHISRWEIEEQELLYWGRLVVAPLAQKAHKGLGSYNPGSWCQFCRAKHHCKARANSEVIEHLEAFAIEANKLSDEQRVDLYLARRKITSYLRDLESYVLSRFQKGEPIEGLKMVYKEGRKKWLDDQKVIQRLLLTEYDQKDVVNMKPKSISDIKKLFGENFDKFVGDLIGNTDGTEEVVSQDDPRFDINFITNLNNDNEKN